MTDERTDDPTPEGDDPGFPEDIKSDTVIEPDPPAEDDGEA